jgi:hypothetical protein
MLMGANGLTLPSNEAAEYIMLEQNMKLFLH